MIDNAILALPNSPDPICKEIFLNRDISKDKLSDWRSNRALPFTFNEESIYCWIKYLAATLYTNEKFEKKFPTYLEPDYIDKHRDDKDQQNMSVWEKILMYFRPPTSLDDVPEILEKD